MTTVQLDFETASEAKITGKDSVGAWRYAEDPSTHVLSLAYKISGDRSWDSHSPRGINSGAEQPESHDHCQPVAQDVRQKHLGHRC